MVLKCPKTSNMQDTIPEKNIQPFTKTPLNRKPL